MATFNKGDVSEGILAASITARFISKNNHITLYDVVDVINRLKKPVGSGKTLVTTSEFRTTDNDTVICKIGLATSNMTALLETSNYNSSDIKSILTSAILYANSRHITELVTMIQDNNQRNTIKVLSDGLINQSGTKVDLYVLIDDVKVGVGVNLKYGTVKQFGQVWGASSSSIINLFEPLGVKFTQNQLANFEQSVSDKKPTEALCIVYKIAAEQLKRLSDTELKVNLAKFIDYHATKHESDVLMVRLNKGTATTYNFNDINKTLAHNLDIVYSESKTSVIQGKSIPTIKIISPDSNSHNVLLQIRCKLEGNRTSSVGKKIGLSIRNYIEKGSLLNVLLGEKIQ